MVGIDFSAAMVAEASRRFPGLVFREDDAEDLPFPDGCFDAVVCNFVDPLLGPSLGQHELRGTASAVAAGRRSTVPSATRNAAASLQVRSVQM